MSFPRRQLALLIALPLTLLPARGAAQVAWSGRLGALWTSTMVTDQIAGSTIELRPAVQPALVLEASTPIPGRSRLDASAQLQVTTGTLTSHEGGTNTDVAGMRTLAFTLGVAGDLLPGVRLRAGAGVVSYATSEDASVFQRGAPMRPMGAAELGYRRHLRGPWWLSTAVQYDFHPFTTEQLRSRGYTGSQAVHRVGITVGVGR